MKKRILSMLLLVAMVVTAMPLVALPAVAAEAPDYTQEDYNSLFVQDGLVFAMDYYASNEHWGNIVPKLPHEETAYTYEGKTYNFTLQDDRIDYKVTYTIGSAAAVTVGTFETGAEAEAAIAAKKAESEALAAATYSVTYVDEAAYVYACRAAIDAYRYAGTMAPVSLTIANGADAPAASVVIADGMISLDGYYYFQHVDQNLLSKMNYGYDGATMEINRTITTNGNLFTFAQARFKLTSGGVINAIEHSSNGVKLDSAPGITLATPSAHHTYTLSFQRPQPLYAPNNSGVNGTAYVTDTVTVEGEDEPQRIVDLSQATYSIKHREIPCELYTPAYVKNAEGEIVPNTEAKSYYVAAVDRFQTGELHLYQDGETLYSRNDISYVNTAFGQGDAFIVLWGSPDGAMSALRYYAKQLTAAERAQNHLADILKWFRLDISYVKLLDEAGMATLAELAADFTLDSARADVAAALESEAKALAEAQYESVLDADVLAVAAYYGLDISRLASYPKGVLSATYSYLLSLKPGDEGVAEGYAAAFLADINAYLAANAMSAEEYDDLYVSRGLEFAMDFFKSNPYWNTDNTVYTVPVGAAENTAYVYGGKTYDLTKTENRYGWGVVTLGATVQNNKWYNTTVYATEAEAQAVIDAMPEADRSKYAVYKRVTDVFLAAHDEWVKADQAFLAQFTIKNPVAAHLFSYDAGFGPNCVQSYNDAAANSAKNFSVYRMGEGYIQLRNDYHSSGGLQVNAKNYSVADSYTFQATMALGGKATATCPVLMNGVRPAASVVGQNPYFFTKQSDGAVFTATDISSVAGIANSATETVSLSYTLTGACVAGGTDDKMVIRTEDGLVSTYIGTYTKTGTNGKPDGTTYFGFSKSMPDARIYAYRHYTVDLTDAELAQNHFADLAKFFRLNLSGLSTLSAEEKITVYDAMKAFDLSSDRVAVQSALSAVMTPYVKAAYADMKGEDATINAFLDLAADYLLDVETVLNATRDVSSVFTTVTASALAGKSVSEAQALFAEAYFDAYYYLSYACEGKEEWNSFLSALAAAPTHLDTEALMALPLSLRHAAASQEPTQEAIDAYVAGAMEAYNAAEYDYDSLYVRNGLMTQIDFFKTNRYWNEKPTLPTAPIVEFGEDALFKTDKYIVVKWDNVNKTQFSHFYKDGGGTWQSTTSTSNPPVIFTDIEGGATAAAQAEEVAASLRTSLSNPLIEAVPYPGNTANEGVNDDYQALINAYKTAINTQLSGFIVTGSEQFVLSLPTVSYKSYHDQTATHQYAPFVYGDGYLQMDHHHSNCFLLLRNSYSKTGITTGEMIATAGEATAMHFMQVSDVTVRINGPTFESFKIQGFYNYEGTPTVNLADGPVVAIPNTVPFSMGLSVDRGDGSGSLVANIYVNGENLVTQALTDTTPAKAPVTQLGYSVPKLNNRVYALRYYNRALTAADYAQNHFADLAKFFRIDVSVYDLLSDALKSELYNAVAAFTFDSDRDDIVAAVNAVMAKHYADVEIFTDEAKNAEFVELAMFAGLDLSPIELLSDAERQAIAAAVMADFMPGYARSVAVVRGVYRAQTLSLSALSFAGYQVRIDTGVAEQNYAGVRAVFDIDEDVILEIVKTGKEVAVSAEVAVAGNRAAVITFLYGYDAENDALTLLLAKKAVPGEDGDIVTDAVAYDREVGGKTVRSFNYTVTYKGENATAAMYGVEYAYRYHIVVGDNLREEEGTVLTFNVTSARFGDTVTALEVYGAFAEMEKYADDAMIKSVMAAQ